MAPAGGQTGGGTDHNGGEELSVWDSKLVEQGGYIGYLETRSGKKGFAKRTNFKVECVGVVTQPATCQGAMLKVTLDDGHTEVAYCSNEDMSYQQSMLRALKAAGLGKSLFVSGQLDPDLGSYVHQLCDKYKREHPGSFRKAVQIIGKQPGDNVWVLNETVQVNADGEAIRPEDQKYAIIDGHLSRHYLEVKVVSGMVASVLYETFVAISPDGTCPVVVALGESCCGKTTALKCAQMLTGTTEIYHELTAAKASDVQENTTMGFAWDDPENLKVVEEVTVSCYNQMLRGTIKKSRKPRCMPVITTNLKGDKVRMVNATFDPVANHKLPNKERVRLEYELKAAKTTASRSIGKIISLRKELVGVDAEGNLVPTETFLEEMEGYVEKFEEIMPTDEGRSARNYATIAWIAMRLLKMAGMGEEEEEAFWAYVTEKMGPQYATMQQRAGVPGTSHASGPASGPHSNWLKDVFAALQTIDQLEVLKMVNPSIRPRGTCDCEEAVAFHVDSVQQFLKTACPDAAATVRSAIRKNGGCRSVKTIFADDGHPSSSRVQSKYATRSRCAPHISYGSIDTVTLKTFLDYMDNAASSRDDNAASSRDDNAASSRDDNAASSRDDKAASSRDDNAASSRDDNAASSRDDNAASSRDDNAVKGQDDIARRSSKRKRTLTEKAAQSWKVKKK
ncbi:hypothetical protein Bbelb_321440 [Branchiostoma belcheri]|nr:hypothetical protein Bbelb_321440 [Branchiostoma belcheri]